MLFCFGGYGRIIIVLIVLFLMDFWKVLVILVVDFLGIGLWERILFVKVKDICLEI